MFFSSNLSLSCNVKVPLIEQSEKNDDEKIILLGPPSLVWIKKCSEFCFILCHLISG